MKLDVKAAVISPEVLSKRDFYSVRYSKLKFALIYCKACGTDSVDML